MPDTKIPPPPWVELLKLTPKDALAWFINKQRITSTNWKDVWGPEHARAFTIAGMLREDLLKTVHEALGTAIEEGRDVAWFQKELLPTLRNAGWLAKEVVDPDTGEVSTDQSSLPTRLRLIYDTNVRSAYAAGTWEESERTKATAPLMMYRTMRDERVRITHAAWDGIVLPRDDPWWLEHAPPCGWGCRCIAIPISEDGVQDYIDAGRIKIKRQAPDVEYKNFDRNGEIVKVPVGVDPGFGHHPLKARDRSLDGARRRQRADLPDEIRKAAEKLDKKP
jgi:SPP1 gp7 family putative phage head morphogenesis protein